MIGVTGIGSWPGGEREVEEAQRAVRDLLTDPPEGLAALPYLPELPGRGPGSDMLGRTAGLLVGLDVELTPSGWALTAAPGRDSRRTAGLWQHDLDALAEVFDGYAGPLKLQVVGPWTLAAGIWLPRGERVLSDPGAVRDLGQSLADGLRDHVARIRALLPGATAVIQLDEPGLAGVLGGRVLSASGLRRLDAPDPTLVRAVLADVVEAARGVAERADPFGAVAVHTCARPTPGLLEILADAAPDALALDVDLLPETPGAAWERLAGIVDGGIRLWCGTSAAEPEARALALGERLDLGDAALADLVLTPSCGLAGSTAAATVQRHRDLVRAAGRVADALA